MLKTDNSAAVFILNRIKTLEFDGIDLDYEGGYYGTDSPIYQIADAATEAGLKLTAAPYSNQSDWRG